MPGPKKNPIEFSVGQWVNVEKVRVNENGTLDLIVKDEDLPASMMLATANRKRKPRTAK